MLFWRDGVFIVKIHHRQFGAIKLILIRSLCSLSFSSWRTYKWGGVELVLQCCWSRKMSYRRHLVANRYNINMFCLDVEKYIHCLWKFYIYTFIWL